MTSLEKRRQLLGQAEAKLLYMEQTRASSDLLPVLHAMMKFMQSMLEEDESQAMFRILRQYEMDR